jgi:DNA-binding response OmpR family regulator
MGRPEGAADPAAEAAPRWILVVEDDERIAWSLRRGLQQAGYLVDIALDGAQGLRLALDGGYDLVVLDLLLPGRGGLDLCRRLRANGKRTPVLVLTAYDGDEVEATAYAAGADGFITKPFSFPILVAQVQLLLRADADRAGEPVAVTGLRLDPARRRCWRGDAEIALTPREFALLEFLVRRAGRVASRREILDGVWDRDYDGDPEIVEVYIGRLRRKLDQPFGGHAVETVGAVGYRLATR